MEKNIIQTYIEILSVVGIVLVFIRISSSFFKSKEKFDYASCKTIGTREIQEDNYDVVKSKAGMMLTISDGMGKSYGGKVASRVAIETFVDIFDSYNAFDNPKYYFRKSFSSANREILKTLDGSNGYAGVLSVIIRDNLLYYALVGNLKLCIFRKNSLIEVSSGHTIDVLVKEKYEKGKIKRADAITILEEKKVYNFLGQDGFEEIEYFDEPIMLETGDIVALMSDGLYETLGFKCIEETLSNRQKNAQKLAFELIEKVNDSEKEDKDNSSIILVKVER